MRKATNTLRLRADGQTSTDVEMQAEVKLNPMLGWLMRPIIEIQLHKLVDQFVEELKYYAETGNIHPRKLKALRKAARSDSNKSLIADQH